MSWPETPHETVQLVMQAIEEGNFTLGEFLEELGLTVKYQEEDKKS